MVKIFFNEIINQNPVFEPRFDQIYHRSSSNLLALYVNLLIYKNWFFNDGFGKEQYFRLSRELADLSLKIRSNDLSRLVLMQQVVRTIEDEKYKRTLTDYLEIIRYIDSINENKIIFKNEISKAREPEAVTERLINEYRVKFANPYIAAERGYIDDVIKPHETRSRLIKGLKMLSSKVDSNPKKKHGNIPL